MVDPTGEIVIQLAEAKDLPPDGAWYVPGCFVLADGIFEEDGTFSVYTLGQPPCERRDASGEVFGHVDFLGTGVTLDMGCSLGGGSQGRAMRRVEKGLDHIRFIALCDVELDVPKTYTALRKIFDIYADDPPLVCVLAGNFTSIAFGANGDSVAYKEHFNELAALLADYPTLTESTTFVFVPGDNDPSISSSTGGASPLLPRRAISELFTNRIKQRLGKNAVFTSNPARVGYFSQELVIARDAMTARFRRHAIRFAKQEAENNGEERMEETVDASVKIGRKLVRTLLSQASLSPFPLALRPVLWDFASALNLYPLPTAVSSFIPYAQIFMMLTLCKAHSRGSFSASILCHVRRLLCPEPRANDRCRWKRCEMGRVLGQGRRKCTRDDDLVMKVLGWRFVDITLYSTGRLMDSNAAIPCPSKASNP